MKECTRKEAQSVIRSMFKGVPHIAYVYKKGRNIDIELHYTDYIATDSARAKILEAIPNIGRLNVYREYSVASAAIAIDEIRKKFNELYIKSGDGQEYVKTDIFTLVRSSLSDVNLVR